MLINTLTQSRESYVSEIWRLTYRDSPIYGLNSSPLWTKWRDFADDSFKYIFANEVFYILIKISLKIIPKGPIDNNPALV